ncbi:MAG: DUF4271 domain-containing protein [Bacteroidota bacterium]
MKSVISAVKTETDSTLNYADFLVDSLNFTGPDTVFHFELKEIILPEESFDSVPKLPVYDKPSIFAASKVNPVKINPEIRQNHNLDWLTALFLVCLVLLAWIKYYNLRRIKQVFRAVIARHNVNQLVRDGNLPEERITPGLALIYITCLAVVLYQFGYNSMSTWLGITIPSVIFLVFFGGITFLWILKIAVIKGTGIIFRTKQDTSELILTNLIYNAAGGIVIFPFVITGYYTGSIIILKIAVGILLTGMGFRFFRSLSVGITAQSFSVLYLFLYLCTLEILPVLFLYRLVTYTE